MQKKWIAGGLLVLGLLGMCGCSSQAFVSEQQTETVLTKEETGWEFQDGTYQMEVELLGGSGRASVTSPAKVEIKDGKAVATPIMITWWWTGKNIFRSIQREILCFEFRWRHLTGILPSLQIQ